MAISCLTTCFHVHYEIVVVGHYMLWALSVQPLVWWCAVFYNIFIRLSYAAIGVRRRKKNPRVCLATRLRHNDQRVGRHQLQILSILYAGPVWWGPGPRTEWGVRCTVVQATAGRSTPARWWASVFAMFRASRVHIECKRSDAHVRC